MVSTSTDDNLPLRFGDPATYRIVIQGTLTTDWSERLAGLAVTSSETGPARTTLEGRIRDQAELNGVLATLYGLHLPILCVEKVEDEISEGDRSR